MAIHASLNSNGFTLVEFLVAIVILMVGLLGLLQTVNYAILHNMNNQLRQEALVLADEKMNLEKAKPFALISTVPPNPYIRREPLQRVVNGAFRSYSIVKTNTETTAQTKNIDLQVTWRYKRDRFVHSISSMVSRFE